MADIRLTDAAWAPELDAELPFNSWIVGQHRVSLVDGPNGPLIQIVPWIDPSQPPREGSMRGLLGTFRALGRRTDNDIVEFIQTFGPLLFEPDGTLAWNRGQSTESVSGFQQPGSYRNLARFVNAVLVIAENESREYPAPWSPDVLAIYTSTLIAWGWRCAVRPPEQPSAWEDKKLEWIGDSAFAGWLPRPGAECTFQAALWAWRVQEWVRGHGHLQTRSGKIVHRPDMPGFGGLARRACNSWLEIVAVAPRLEFRPQEPPQRLWNGKMWVETRAAGVLRGRHELLWSGSTTGALGAQLTLAVRLVPRVVECAGCHRIVRKQRRPRPNTVSWCSRDTCQKRRWKLDKQESRAKAARTAAAVTASP